MEIRNNENKLVIFVTRLFRVRWINGIWYISRCLYIYREITVMLLGDSNRCKNERRKNRR